MEAQSLVFAVQASAPGFAPEAILVLADEQCRDVVIDESVHDGSLLCCCGQWLLTPPAKRWRVFGANARVSGSAA